MSREERKYQAALEATRKRLEEEKKARAAGAAGNGGERLAADLQRQLTISKPPPPAERQPSATSSQPAAYNGTYAQMPSRPAYFPAAHVNSTVRTAPSKPVTKAVSPSPFGGLFGQQAPAPTVNRTAPASSSSSRPAQAPRPAASTGYTRPREIERLLTNVVYRWHLDYYAPVEIPVAAQAVAAAVPPTAGGGDDPTPRQPLSRLPDKFVRQPSAIPRPGSAPVRRDDEVDDSDTEYDDDDLDDLDDLDDSDKENEDPLPQLVRQMRAAMIRN